MACLTIISSSACASLFFPALIARRANKSTCPTRVNEGATRVVIAQLSSIMTSGSRFFAWPFICRTNLSPRRGRELRQPRIVLGEHAREHPCDAMRFNWLVGGGRASANRMFY
jgi:hypothetical protein